MEYEEVLTYINKNVWRGSRLGLGRIRKLLELMGNPQKKLKFVHVAGTNGKGSTSSMIASILQSAGYRTGLFISPFIHRFNERMQINGSPISDEELTELFEEILPFAESMEDKPTEFEWMTALAFEFFYQNNCDIVVLEVGLGGELDSTNVIDTPEVAVITALGMDHTKELGDTIEDIASAKAGIIKKADEDCRANSQTGTPCGSSGEETAKSEDGIISGKAEVVCYGQNTQALSVIETRADQMNCRLTVPDYDTLIRVSADLTGQTFSYGRYRNLRIGLLGTYQPENAAVAIETVEALRRRGWKIGDEALRDGLAGAEHPGRFEIICDNPLIIVDGAHNPQGVQATVKSLKDYFGDTMITILTGVLSDKDVNGIMEGITCSGLNVNACITVTPPNPRAMSAHELAGIIRGMTCVPVTEAEDTAQGCRLALEAAGEDGIICALGSLYMIDEVMKGFSAAGCELRQSM